MGSCTYLPNMPGVRCGAKLGQRMEIQLVRQLGCTVGRAVVPQRWRRTTLGLEGSCAMVSQVQGLGQGHIVVGLQSRRCSPVSLDTSAAAGLPCAFPLSNFSSSRHVQFSHVCGSRGLERSFSVHSLPHFSSPYSSRVLVWGYPTGSTQYRFSSPSRIALAPRVAPELPETARSWLESQRLCPGCGIEMQDEDPRAPGFFQRPVPVKQVQEGEVEEEEDMFADEVLLNNSDRNEIEGKRKEVLEWVDISSSPETDLEDDTEWGELEGNRRSRRGGGGGGKRPRRGKQVLSDSEKPMVCARCHALRNYGRVKDESVENLLPDFDFDHVVGRRLRKSIGRRAVILMVIDSVDFDGSFPRTAAILLADAERELGNSWQEGKAANIPRLLVVLNKADLLPPGLSPVRLEQWARRRSRAGGVTQISGVHIVSAFKGWGVDKLSKQVVEMAGPRGDVWVIGAQNVGKSSLINAIGKHASERALKRVAEGEAERVEGVEKRKNVSLTEAAIPGTTIGVLKLEGILPGKARLLDTPGLLHPHQITTRLTWEEQKMVQVRKVLKPRTFRVKVGHAISLGGLMRLSVETAPGESIYATIWASPYIPCHMGKGETAQELFHKHIGEKLQPPLSKERVDELGRWVARTVEVSGTKWDKSSVDVAIAGVGWIALALSGSARLEVWTYEGVAVTVRDAMVLDLAPVMEKPGFTAPIKKK